MLGRIAVERMENSRGFLLRLLESLPDDHLTTRAGAAGNHALWVMGHIAQSDDAVVSAFTSEPGCLPDGHSKLFAAKTSLSDKAADYPSRAELVLRMTKSRDRVVGWITSLNDQSALQPSPEHLAAFAPNPIAAAHGISQHEFMHAGQIVTVRASLRLKPVCQ